MRWIRRFPAPMALAIVLTLSLQGPALAATVNVSIVDDDFQPATVKPKQGDTVLWTNNGNHPHTVTSNGCSGAPAGVGLFCSGTLNDDQTFMQKVNVAAKYPYICLFHGNMQGTVQVAMKASPASGTELTEFTITWAKTSIPSGYNADIQIKRPGSSQWVNWLIDRTGTNVSATFVADAGPGQYQFRSRLQKISSGGASAYSAARKITVA